jgi:hypothetical protein
MAYWARLFTNWIRKVQIRSIQGAKQIPDANGGSHLVIPKPKYPAQPPQPAVKVFYPFKMYQPSGLNRFLYSATGQMVPMVTITTAVLGMAKIVNSATLTNLALNPPQISVADTWRFWAVRWGYVATRPLYTFFGVHPTFWGNFETNVVPQYVDFPNIGSPPDSTATNADGIIVLGVNPEPISNTISASLWIEVIPDTDDTMLTSAIIRGTAAYSSTPPFDIPAPEPFNPGNNAQIPIGYITGNVGTGIIQSFNLIFDHARNRFPCGHGNWPAGKGNGTIMNVRGQFVWNQTTSAGTVTPADLAGQLFYPGDAIWGYSLGDGILGGSAPDWNTIFEFTGATPAFISAYGGTTIPYLNGDPNWTPWYATTSAPPVGY